MSNFKTVRPNVEIFNIEDKNIHQIYRFANGLGVSVVISGKTIDLAVVRFTGPGIHNYETDCDVLITEDVEKCVGINDIKYLINSVSRSNKFPNKFMSN